jgi:hypothetical protein
MRSERGIHSDLPLAVLRALVKALRINVVQSEPFHPCSFGKPDVGNSDLLRQLCLNIRSSVRQEIVVPAETSFAPSPAQRS